MADKDDNIASDAIEMSDEDFLKMDQSAFDAPADKDDTDTSDDDDDAGDDTDESDDNDDPSAEQIEADRRAALTEEERAAEDLDPDAKDNKDEKDDKSTKNDTDPDDKPDDKPAAGTMTDAQYLDIGKKIMGDIKANGGSMKVKSADDAIQLMQMGANYHKKMAGLKPSLKTLKLLENNGLLDEGKLNFLIDLHQKKPEAITQLLKDSKIDPMSIDLAGEENYVADRRTINDTELALDEVLSSIEDTPTYEATLNVLGTVWDKTSQGAISQDPSIIKTINDHMANGIYEQVAKEVAYERTLGKLAGVSDLDAYRQIGNYMHENNKFRGATVATKTADTQERQQQPENKGETPEQLEQRNRRKLAAGTTRHKKAPAKDDSKFSPLELSDEDWIKQQKLSI